LQEDYAVAKAGAVWGIDIGQCAVKALKCRRHPEDQTRIVAEAFDFIEYPRILSQQGGDSSSDPAELIQEALKLFLSRNTVRGDKIIISVSGQAGLARFIKLPPVESKKIPDIVKYEARQQIPFPLEEVVWDYQQMVGGSVAEGFALDTEVGLFAMKRDQVYKAMKPFTEAGIEVDIIQLTPLALYNYVVFDQMKDLPPPEEYDPDNPPDSVVVVSLGTDTTDLVVTNGFRVWQRSIPLGGNHFTKALTKEMKLTFATAEHLKRNATQAEDPKALFQAMRPVFSDLLTEVQRSIGYFSNIDKKAKIGRALALGNAMKLPGLQRYLAQNLGFELTRVEMFRGLGGTAVVDQPAFKENAPAFGVCYGLALQGLRNSKIHTNLLPPEVAQDRMIRAKKPWAIAAAAALLVGCSISYVQYFRSADYVSMGPNYFGPAVAQADDLVLRADTHKNEFETAKKSFIKDDEIGKSVLQNLEGRELWLELMRAINLCLPRNPPGERPKDIAQREELLITRFECQRYERLEDWWEGVADKDKATSGHQNANANAPPGAPAPFVDPNAVPPPVDPNNPNPVPPPSAAPASGPTGPGWVIQLSGHHFRNIEGDGVLQGMEYVRNTLLANLKLDEIPIPDTERGSEKDAPATYRVKKLGIDWPVAIEQKPIDWGFKIPVEDSEGPAGGKGGDPANRKMKTQPRYDFVVQFCWTEHPPNTKPPVAAAVGAPAAQPAVPAVVQPAAVPDATTPPPAAAPGTETPAVPEAPPAAVPPAAPTTPPATGAPPATAPTEPQP
jgi:type IV pilus assembly protein PilM